MPDLGIVMLHHRDDEVTRANLASFRRHNPGAATVVVSGDEPLTGGVSGRQLTSLGRRWSAATEGGTHKEKSWHNCDLLLYSWYLERDLECARWLVVEWDVFSTCPAEEFY